MRVVVGDPGFRVDRVRKLLDGHELDVVSGGEPWEGDDVVALLIGTHVRVTAEDLARLPALRIVASCSVGYDHVAYGEAERRGIWVCNVPDYCVEEVADHSLPLLLGLLRGIVQLDRSVREGACDWTAAGELRRIQGHAAWYSAEAEKAVYRRPVLSVRNVLEGREPAGAVNRP